MNLKEQYKHYLRTDGDLPMQLLNGGIAIILYTYYGLTGFLTGFIILHILGFIIDIYDLDEIDKKARFYKAKKITEKRKQDDKQEG